MSANPGYTRRSVIGTAGAVTSAIALAGCTEQDPANGQTGTDGDSGKLSGTISISGSSTVYPLCKAVSEEFRKENGDVNVNVRSTGRAAASRTSSVRATPRSTTPRARSRKKRDSGASRVA